MIGFLVQISSVKIYVMVTGVGDGDFSVEECDSSWFRRIKDGGV